MEIQIQLLINIFLCGISIDRDSLRELEAGGTSWDYACEALRIICIVRLPHTITGPCIQLSILFFSKRTGTIETIYHSNKILYIIMVCKIFRLFRCSMVVEVVVWGLCFTR
jgi:hypothetical protein